MIINSKVFDFNPESLPVSSFWSEKPHKEIRMHKIHAYPAKFPSLVVQRSIELAKENKLPLNTIADVFCGCGTTALEAKINKINFWGCDINPVATLIARAKSHKYNESILLKYHEKILTCYHGSEINTNRELIDHERIIYWFAEKQRTDLHKLIQSIYMSVPNGKYLDFYLCAFSNILKGCSNWLTKSIKPQVDPNKTPADVITSFNKQVFFMVNASSEVKDALDEKSNVNILNTNFLNFKINKPFVDMVITSPPYATSYEYADLHQLSALWLSYTRDYRDLRQGTIGSLYHREIKDSELARLNSIGKQIYTDLMLVDKSKAKSVAKYFIDIDRTVTNVKQMLRKKGNAIFIVGNTQYKGVRVDNAKFLAQSLLNSGFTDVQIFKRKIGFKSLTPYRDKRGKFSSNSNDRKVYDYEYVLLAGKSKN